MECLNNIIGITASDCGCVISGLNPEQVAAAKKSVSGLYLDGNLDGGVSLADVKLLENCGDYYALAAKAIKSAQRAYFDDVQLAVSSKYKVSKPKFIGEIGRLSYAAFLPASKDIQYLKITPLNASAAVVKINNLRLNINATLPQVSVKIIQVLDGYTYGDTVLDVKVDTVANKFTSVPIPENLRLPLTINSRKIEYFILWERTGAEQPVDNSVSCGCSGGDAYKDYFTLTGGESASINDLNGAPDRFAHGISIDAEVFCAYDNLICQQYSADNDVALLSAWAVLYKAGELLIEYVLQSSELSRFTMMNREYLWGKRNHFKKEYNDRLLYFAQEVDITASDCFVCRDKKMFVGNIYG